MQMLDKLTGDGTAIPQTVVGRHCQGDADIFAYECCDYSEPLAKNIETLKLYLEQQRLLSGSEMMNLHLTMANKAGRYEASVIKEYQANRTNRDPLQQERVWELRHFMATYSTDTITPYPWNDREADDGMSMMQRDRIKTHGVPSSVIMTMDKDLRMVPGLHIHPSTLDANTAPDGYGACYICEKTSSKKVVGWGTSFFWHQMLMGDTADNIPGLPKITGADANTYKPTKKFNPDRRPLACGPVMAYAILDGITDEKMAMATVIKLYRNWYNSGPVTHWNGEEVHSTWQQRFYEQAKLLWMMRDDNFDDYLVYLEEVMK